jgi:hypothetical protein
MLLPYVALLYSHSNVIARLFRLDTFMYSAACAMDGMEWNAVGVRLLHSCL